MHRYLLSALAAAAMAACGGDDQTTGPTGSLNVGGTWSASISNLSGEGASCSTSSPIRVTLRQTGSTFTGSYSGGVLTCLTATESFSSAVPSGNVANGQVAGTKVTFDLGSPDFHHDGSLNGTSMSGTATWTYDFGFPLEQVALTGGWSAVRQ
jgi:hypothetical protein